MKKRTNTEKNEVETDFLKPSLEEGPSHLGKKRGLRGKKKEKRER